MRKIKSKKIITIIIISSILIVGSIFLYLYFSNNSNRYSFGEKRWINEEKDSIMNVNITSDLPVFSSEGLGVYYDFLRDFESDTTLSFNILHDTDESISFTQKSSIAKDDIVFYKDHFVVISKEGKNVISLNDLKNNTVGIVTSDLNKVSNYLKDISSITFKTYSSIDDVQIGLNSNDISMAIVPLYKSLDKILMLDYSIDFHLDGLYSYYVLTVDGSKELRSIASKFLNRWSEQLENKMGEYFLNLYYDINQTTEVEKESITSRDYNVGYIQNVPYEGMINRNFSGMNAAYLNSFAKLTGATYKYKEYSSIKKLISALNDKKVDIAFNPYTISNSNYDDAVNSNTNEFVVLAHYKHSLIVNSLYALDNMSVSMVDNMNLTKSMESKKLFNIEKYDSIKSILKNADEESIIILEKYVYDYYKDKDLKNFSIRYDGNILLNNSYLLKSSNESFNKLFSFYIDVLSHKETEYQAVNNSISNLRRNVISSFLLNNLFYVSLIILVIILVIYKVSSKFYVQKRIKKEDRMLYLDILTNLKNRNYLNDNIEYWEKNKVYPQAVVLLDLNKVKELNDKYGHEEGDKQIQSAANVLIRTQRENSEIIRTDGNEFMVYLVGYDEKFIISYLHKLNREFKISLPYESYGVAIGYSIIENDIKTIDDAINEAAIMMRENKGSNKIES